MLDTKTCYLLQDLRLCEVYAIEYMIDNGNMGFLLSDREKNITICMYQPEARESLGGRFFFCVLFVNSF